MDEKEFEYACAQLSAAKLNIVDKGYDESSFGSWHITLATNPSRRIIWDGRDDVLSVEEETEDIFNSASKWKTLFTTERLQYEDVPVLMNQIIDRVK